MNKLILVGNGFDLAHQLPTRYNDFILWYLKACFNEAQEKHRYEDKFLQINRVDFPFPKPGVGPSELVEHFYNSHTFNTLFEPIIRFPGFPNGVYNPFEGSFKISFFEKLLTKCSASTWVDIENEFYSQLKAVLNSPHSKSLTLADLNDGMEFLISKLEAYLQSLQLPPVNEQYIELLNAPFEKKEFNLDVINVVGPNAYQSFNPDPQEMLILNFNYTLTFEQYLRRLKETTQINYIHGKIGDAENRIIFGFGDELDKDYERLEAETTRGFFSFIKSFWYLKTSNYHDLIRFIDSDYYQVHVLGHSCGLSDRTMLNMVFEHQNCKSIKIHYHRNESGNNNYTELTQEISRHFKDKGLFRKKLVNFEYCTPMPQIT